MIYMKENKKQFIHLITPNYTYWEAYLRKKVTLGEWGDNLEKVACFGRTIKTND